MQAYQDRARVRLASLKSRNRGEETYTSGEGEELGGRLTANVLPGLRTESTTLGRSAAHGGTVAAPARPGEGLC